MRTSGNPASEYVIPATGIWALTFAVFVVDVVWIVATDFTIDIFSFLTNTVVVVILLSGATVYTRYRPDPIIAGITGALAFMLMFNSVGVVLSYLTTSVNFPLQDQVFANADTALGFDWLNWTAQVNDLPVIAWILEMAYRSSIMQIAFVILCLAVIRRFAQLREFVEAYVLTGLAIIAISALFPAVGTFYHYGLVPADFPNITPLGTVHIDQYLGLRDGSIRNLTMTEFKGIVTFPSFHTAVAVLTAWALRNVRYINILAALASAAVIVAALSYGSHYLIDLLAGAAVTILVLFAHRRFLATRLEPELQSASGRYISPESELLPESS